MMRPPAAVPGHWTTPEGQEIAAEYMGKDRADLAHGDQTDLELANSIFMAGREDLSLIGFQEAAKQRIRWLSAQLAARDEQLRRTEAALAESPQGPLVYVPGHWECAKCGFGLISSNLNMGDGSVTARDEPGERCPNDGAPLWRVSWKGMAEEFGKRLEEEIPARRGLEEQLERVKAALARRSVPTMDPTWTAAFNAALDMVSKALEEFPAEPQMEENYLTRGMAELAAEVSTEEKKMIPQETADLAEILKEEFGPDAFGPDLSGDSAESKAGRILDAFKEKGWKIVEVVG